MGIVGDLFGRTTRYLVFTRPRAVDYLLGEGRSDEGTRYRQTACGAPLRGESAGALVGRRASFRVYGCGCFLHSIGEISEISEIT